MRLALKTKPAKSDNLHLPGLAARTYDVLAGKLMTLEFEPGARISIDVLARELGVSQTPIREALSRLEAEGLVVKAPNIGYSAADQLNRVQFGELFELRMQLEPFAAGRAAERMSDGALRRLEQVATQMVAGDAAAKPVAYGRFAGADAQVHHLIAVGSGNLMIADMLQRLHSHLHIFRLLFRTSVASDALNEHAQLIGALIARDSVLAEAAMRSHLLKSYERIKRLITP